MFAHNCILSAELAFEPIFFSVLFSISDNVVGKENESRMNSTSNNKGSSIKKIHTIKTPVKKPPVRNKSSEKPNSPKLNVSINLQKCRVIWL